MKRIVIAGAGGFGGEVAWVLRRMAPDVKIAGFCDDNPDAGGGKDGSIPYLGKIEEVFNGFGDCGFFCAIGNNRVRSKVLALCDARGVEIISVIDPTAVVASDSVIGAGSFVGANAVVSTGCRLGRGCIVNHNVTVGHDVSAADLAQFCPGVRVSGGCYIGEGALLGSNSCTMPGRRMEAWSTLGAGAVLLKDLDEGGSLVRLR